MSCDTSDSSVVLFFFARERLLFRCPSENPFVLDVSTTVSVSNSINPTLNSSNNPNAIPSLGGGASGALKAQSKQPSMAPSLQTAAGDASNRVEGGGDQDSRGNAAGGGSVTAVGLSTRYKKKIKKLGIVHSDSGSDLAGASYAANGKVESNDGVTTAAASYSSVPLQGGSSGTKLRRPVPMHPSNASSSLVTSPHGSTETSATLPAAKARPPAMFGGGGVSWMEPDRIAPPATTMATCVGIHVNSLLHLLRVPFAGFTTINLNDCTLLVVPLTSAGMTESQTLLHSSTAAPRTTSGEAKESERPKRSRAATAMLVAAMRRPDTDSGTISRFLQCFMNILYREEQRAQYVSTQIKVMEQLLKEWERGRGGGGSSGASVVIGRLRKSIHSFCRPLHKFLRYK